MNALSVYKINEKYLIIVNDNDVIKKLIEFSAERKCCRAQGVSLVKNSDINLFLNISLDQLVQEFGQPHVDIGSGFYIPA